MLYEIYIGSELSYSKIIFILHFSFYLTTLFRAEETRVSSEVERTNISNIGLFVSIIFQVLATDFPSLIISSLFSQQTLETPLDFGP